MRYCTNCLYPETKPDLWFDNAGAFNACSNLASRREVDWDSRLDQLKEVLGCYKISEGSNYDCNVPARGGKDSHYQIIRMPELGMKRSA